MTPARGRQATTTTPNGTVDTRAARLLKNGTTRWVCTVTGARTEQRKGQEEGEVKGTGGGGGEVDVNHPPKYTSRPPNKKKMALSVLYEITSDSALLFSKMRAATPASNHRLFRSSIPAARTKRGLDEPNIDVLDAR